MDSLTAVLLALLAVIIAAVACIVIALRRRNGGAILRTSLELTPQDGWSLLNLTLANRHDSKIWVDRAAFVLADLDAEMQSGFACCQGSLNVREFVQSREVLRVSMIEAVYNAAGKPQGIYAFRFLGAVRYRLGNRWIESETPAYQVNMVRLSATRVRRAKSNDQSVPNVANIANPLELLAADSQNSQERALPHPGEDRASSPEDLKRSLHSV